MLRNIDIRPFDGSFADTIPTFINRIQREEFGIDITLGQQPDLFAIRERYQTEKGNFWVASHAGELIGTIALIDAGEGTGVIRKMFVRTDWRGTPERVAQRLFDTLLAWAKEKGFSELTLGTVDILKTARRFYERNGFTFIDEATLPQHVARMKMPDDNVYYHRRLAA